MWLKNGDRLFNLSNLESIRVEPNTPYRKAQPESHRMVGILKGGKMHLAYADEETLLDWIQEIAGTIKVTPVETRVFIDMDVTAE
jgi:hypothetical protein